MPVYINKRGNMSIKHLVMVVVGFSRESRPDVKVPHWLVVLGSGGNRRRAAELSDVWAAILLGSKKMTGWTSRLLLSDVLSSQ